MGNVDGMIRFCLHSLLYLLLVSLIIFFLLDFLPGDPASIMLGVEARPDTLAALRTQMHLDEPAFIRYILWIKGLMQGDMGESLVYGQSNASLIAQRLALSIPLALISLILSFIIAFPVGVYAAAKGQKWQDRLLFSWMQISLAIPNFWLALLLMLIFAVGLNILPAGGFDGWFHENMPPLYAMMGALKALILPALALSIPQAAILAKTVRSAVLETMQSPYILTAYAKGASPHRVLWLHSLPNAMIMCFTLMGLQLSFLIAGTILIEKIFFLPGIGELLFKAVSQRDLPLVKNIILLFIGLFIIINLAVQRLNRWLDKRLERSHALT